jgi:hypothetical protein
MGQEELLTHCGIVLEEFSQLAEKIHFVFERARAAYCLQDLDYSTAAQ